MGVDMHVNRHASRDPKDGPVESALQTDPREG